MGIPPPSERGLTRRDLLTVTSAGAGTLFAVACETKSPPSGLNVQKTVEAPARATTTAAPGRPRPTEQPPVVQRPPTSLPTAVPKPEAPVQFPATPPLEGLRTDEERAKASTVFEWLKNFSKQPPLPQSTNVRTPKIITGSGTYGSYAISLTDANTWIRRIPDIARSTKGYKSPQPLQARWTTWWVEFDNPRAMGVMMFGLGVYAGKYTGEVQMDSIELGVVKQDPTPADRASGITWMGAVTIGFATKYRSALLYVDGPQELDGFRTREADTMKNFITSQADPPLPQFSGWQNDGWQATVKLKQGRWEVESGISGLLSEQYLKIGSPLYGIGLPAGLVDPVFVKQKNLCAPNAQSGCRLTQMKLPQ